MCDHLFLKHFFKLHVLRKELALLHMAAHNHLNPEAGGMGNLEVSAESFVVLQNSFNGIRDEHSSADCYCYYFKTHLQVQNAFSKTPGCLRDLAGCDPALTASPPPLAPCFLTPLGSCPAPQPGCDCPAEAVVGAQPLSPAWP